MAYLANPIYSEHADRVSQLGLPLLGRQIALFFSGISVCLGGSYFVIHGGTDSRWLLIVASAVLLLNFAHVMLMLETSWQAQMLSLRLLDSRWMWEYVAMQPLRATLIAGSQGYLAWRYYALSKNSRNHRRVAYIVSLITAVEWSLYVSITIVTTWKHFRSTSVTSDAYFKSTITRLYCSVCVLSNLADTLLAFCFCKRLWSLRGEDPEIDASVRYVCYVALGVGLGTTATVIAVALLFLFARDDSFRLVAELAPPCYAASFYLSLLSREKIRRTISRGHTRRLRAAEARLEDTLRKCEIGEAENSPERTIVHGAMEEDQRSGTASNDDDTLSLSAILRDGRSDAEKSSDSHQKEPPILASSASALILEMYPTIPVPAAPSPLLGSLQTWVYGPAPRGSNSATPTSVKDAWRAL